MQKMTEQDWSLLKKKQEMMREAKRTGIPVFGKIQRCANCWEPFTQHMIDKIEGSRIGLEDSVTCHSINCPYCNETNTFSIVPACKIKTECDA